MDDTHTSIVVRRNPGYNANLKKEWLVLKAGACVGEFDDRAEAIALLEKVISELPKRPERSLSRVQELQQELCNTPRNERKHRKQLKAEIKIIKAQEGHEKEKSKERRVKKVETTTEAKKSPLQEAYDVLLPKTTHYHKKRRGRCNREKGDGR